MNRNGAKFKSLPQISHNVDVNSKRIHIASTQYGF